MDRSRPVNDGGIIAWQGLAKKALKAQLDQILPVLETIKADAATVPGKLSPKKWNRFLYNEDPKAPGLVLVLEKELATSTNNKRLDQLERLRSDVTCQTCMGSRLSSQANSVLVDGKTI